MFIVHSVSQRPNLRHLGEPLGGAKSLLEVVSFKEATKSQLGVVPCSKMTLKINGFQDIFKGAIR